MATPLSSPEPARLTLTRPAPDWPSTTVSASLAWASCSFCCIAWACFMIEFRSFISYSFSGGLA